MGKSKINQIMVQSLQLLLIEENLEQSLTVINQILKKENENIDALNLKRMHIILF